MENLSLFSNYPFMQIMFLGNPVFAWLVAALMFFVALAVLKIFKAILLAKLKSLSKKTKTEIDDIVIGAIQVIHWPFYVLVALYFALHFISIPYLVQQWAFYLFLIAIVYYVIKALQEFIDYGIGQIIKRKEAEESDTQVIKLFGTVVKIILWIGAIVLLLSNLGYNVTSLIAGLGIGGIAVALALQNILKDVFSSVSIYLDKPFKVGDFIIVGEHMGTVKKIGIKTTRIQAL